MINVIELITFLAASKHLTRNQRVRLSARIIKNIEVSK